MSLTENDVMAPLLLVSLIMCFMVAVPWVQSRRFTRWRAAEGAEESPARYFFKPSFGGSFVLLDLVGVFLLILLFGSSILFADNLPETKQAISLELVIGNVVFQLTLLCIILTRLHFLVGGLGQTLGLAQGGWPRIAFSALILFALSFYLAVALGVLGWQNWVESTFGARSQEMVELMGRVSDPQFKFWLVLSAVVVAPICEEVVFRGYLFGALRDLAGPIPAVLLSGVFFGLIHANLQALPVLCFLGIGLGFIYHQTRSIWAPILCHFLFNSFTTVLQLLFPQV